MSKNDKEIAELLELIFQQAKMQFGPAIRSRWLHDVNGCTGCGGVINVLKFKNKYALSLNASSFGCMDS
ncbi:MAG TPA: hypothetical protein DDW24_10020 [Blastocatellia bacterium]|nr:hypothetical protein [Blastocatellia bacterium]